MSAFDRLQTLAIALSTSSLYPKRGAADVRGSLTMFRAGKTCGNGEHLFHKAAGQERAKAAHARSAEARQAHLELALRLVRIATDLLYRHGLNTCREAGSSRRSCSRCTVKNRRRPLRRVPAAAVRRLRTPGRSGRRGALSIAHRLVQRHHCPTEAA